jgi:tRNA(Ile)-lysidine synthase TilS/MesJ
MARELTAKQQLERSIIKKYRKDLWNKFVMGIKEYDLICDGDKICVALSGGKSSLLMAKCLQHLKMYSKVDFDVEFVYIDPCFSRESEAKAAALFDRSGVEVRIYSEDISAQLSVGDSVERYGSLLEKRLGEIAEELGCNKLATGENFDSVIEYIFTQMVYEGRVQTIPPRYYGEGSKVVEIIRPMYTVKESFIADWVRYCGLDVTENPFEGTAFGESAQVKDYTERKEFVKSLMTRFRHTNPNIENNIFKSVYNVNLRTVIGWQQGSDRYSFLDFYDTDSAGSADDFDDGDF